MAAAARPDAMERHILVLSNPIHTDIAIPVDDDIRMRFGFLAQAGVPIGDQGVRYLVFGWGGRSFYLETPRWADLKPLPVLRALTADRSVMHVDVTGELPTPHPSIIRLDVGNAGFARLLDFLDASFVADQNGPMSIDGAGYGDFDAFFEAKGFFNAMLGCNTWTAMALREAGIRTGLWNPLPKSLIASLTLFN